MKFCKKCQSVTERCKRGACIVCHRARTALYHARNPNYAKISSAAHRLSKPDYMTAYRAANADKIKANRAAWYENNKEKEKAYAIAWMKSHPDEVKRTKAVVKHRRRSRERNAGGSHTSSDIKNILLLQREKCACCNVSIKHNYHVDHVMPLAKGGRNDKFNLQLLCPKCNMQKSDKHPVSFMQLKGFLL